MGHYIHHLTRICVQILTIAFNNHQQTAAHNVAIDKLNGIEESLHEIHNNYNWVRPHSKYQSSNSPKPVESYEGDILTLWNEFKKLFDAKRKLHNSSLSEMYCKIKSEIENLRKGTIGTSTLENFYKCKTNLKPNTLKLIASWVENEKRENGEKNGKS